MGLKNTLDLGLQNWAPQRLKINLRAWPGWHEFFQREHLRFAFALRKFFTTHWALP